MATLNTVAKLYDRLTPHERLRLVMGAFAREDDGEAERLVHTCPRFTYKTLDFEYMQLYEAWVRKATEFSLLWIEAVGRYQRVETAIWGMARIREQYINGLNRGWRVAGNEGDFIALEEATKYFAHDPTPNPMETERCERIGELKGMVAGLRRFCAVATLDATHFMAAWTPLLESMEQHRAVLDDPVIPIDEEITTQVEALLRLNWPGLDAAREGNDER